MNILFVGFFSCTINVYKLFLELFIMIKNPLRFSALFLSASIIGGCANNGTNVRSDAPPQTQEEREKDSMGKLFGDKFGVIGLKNSNSTDQSKMNNRQKIWNASLRAVSGYPLDDVEERLGVIVTDWYVFPKNQNERVKVNVQISSSTNNPDVKVSVFVQKRVGQNWGEVVQDPKKSADLRRKIILN